MSVEKVYKCDLCGEFCERGKLMRFGARTLDDRPEDADNIDICGNCTDKPVSDLIAIWQDMRREVLSGT